MRGFWRKKRYIDYLYTFNENLLEIGSLLLIIVETVSSVTANMSLPPCSSLS